MKNSRHEGESFDEKEIQQIKVDKMKPYHNYSLDKWVTVTDYRTQKWIRKHDLQHYVNICPFKFELLIELNCLELKTVVENRLSLNLTINSFGIRFRYPYCFAFLGHFSALEYSSKSEHSLDRYTVTLNINQVECEQTTARKTLVHS